MKTLRIKDICDKGSSNLKQKDVENQNGVYPVFGASGLIGKIDTYHQNKDYIAIVKDGSGIGRVTFMPAFSSVIGTLQYILPKEGFNIKYISYCLQSLDLAHYKQGAAIPHIYFRDYGEYEVNVEENPDDQQRIVSYLDAEFAKIEALKANAEKQLQAAKDLFQAALKELLTPKEGWVEKNITQLAENLDSKRIPITSHLRKKGIYPYYGASGIVDYVADYIFDDDLLLISEDGANLLARSTPIAFSVSGKIWVNNHAHIFKFTNMCTQKYVEYYFASINVSEYVTGAAQPKLAQKMLNRIPISIPDNIKEQKAIVSQLDKIYVHCQSLEGNYAETITLCNDLKQSLLKKIFE